MWCREEILEEIMEEKLLKLIAESDNLVEIADKYIAFRYFETASLVLFLFLIAGGLFFVLWQLTND